MKGLQGLTKAKHHKALCYVKQKLLDLLVDILIKGRTLNKLQVENDQKKTKMIELELVCLDILEDIYCTDYMNSEVMLLLIKTCKINFLSTKAHLCISFKKV
jgi:hypothetical protein